MASDQVRYAWAPITKREKQADGSVIVHGPAASPSADRDGQKMDPTWLAQAMPEWFAESANVREQHDPKRAVGVGVGLTQDGDVQMLASRVVDPVAVAKVDAEVLKGYSIGIKAPIIQFGDAEAPNGTIVGGKIIEVSLVDRPANPDCLLTVAKADSTDNLTAVDQAVVEPNAALRIQAAAVVTAVDELGLDLTKADSTDDSPSQIDDARAAIAIIARLIRGEADSLATGLLNECWDIANLLDAVRALRYFISSEEDEALATISKTEADVSKAETTPTAAATDTTSASGSQVDAGTEATAVKTDTTEGAGTAGATTAQLDEYVKSEAFQSAISDAMAKAIAPYASRLEKVENTPLPGGPVIARTASEISAARSVDAEQLRVEAQALLSKAENTGDRFLAEGYRARAEELLAKADA